MRLLLLLFFPCLLSAQSWQKFYKDKLEPGSELLSCDIMHTFEKLKKGGFVYKRYFPESKGIIQYKTYTDEKREILHVPYAE